ncbi:MULTISPECIES: ATP-dependent DNA helicase [unclassified Streptomyces]|uniref:ATP-dependent helicase n=1 Tax=unclassified Streptomyces TaxID=2593676 RepID=UPI00165504A1|nr:ATP-dependent DNA helicase [Streptomyces sp. CB02980]MCB8902983.1 UvrD-helicase domain-containing protein [Streptomyces sp. CB02980]
MSTSSTTRRTPPYQGQPYPGSGRPRNPGAYRLVRTTPAPMDSPQLDATQREVVDHDGGPLLVLAGPGTGKTTTLVEAVAARMEKGADPERLLVLTFSRKAAVELRDRMAARLGGRRPPQATTFHSYCYALIRAHQDAELFAEPLRLLSGPEQDLAVRELLAGHIDLEKAGLGSIRWPDELRACLTTRGFADEVRAVLARSRELGLGPDALAHFAARVGRPDWKAAAGFLAEYLDVLDLQGVLDYTELVHRAVLLAGDISLPAYDAIYVDEYQDTDPAQVRLLHALAGGSTGAARRAAVRGAGRATGGSTVVAFGDPDQSIYAFRGADVNGILDFPASFGGADVRVLRTARRSGAELLGATRLLAQRMPMPRLPADKVRAHRDLTAARDGGGAEAYTYPTASAEAENIADLLRRAHLEDGVPWHHMAVLTRAAANLPSLRRALTSAGVPVETDAADTPLRHEPAVAPLLLALRAVAHADPVVGRRSAGAAGAPPASDVEPASEVAPASVVEPASEVEPASVVEPASEVEPASVVEPASEVAPASVVEPASEVEPASDVEPASEVAPDVEAPSPETAPAQPEGTRTWLTTETALELLASPLAGVDPADLRRLGRALRDEARAAGDKVPPPSDVLLARALAEPERLAAHDPSYTRGAKRLGELLRDTRTLLAGGGTAEEALWVLWSGTPWPGRLERAALRGGPAGRNADRDLDAVCALFETAARAEERVGGRGVLNFLEELDAQDIAADTLTRRHTRPDAVRLMTAHRSKGLEWSLVVVAGVQEGLWPDLRRRGSLLEADRIGRDGLAEPLTPGALLAEERRLFYVAATRARDRLVVTAVKAAAEDGDQPSRFLTELGAEPKDVPGRPRRPLAVSALVAELRATTVDPDASPALRDAAAHRLAELAALADEDGQPLVPAAHPDRWWGLFEPTRSPEPLRDRDRPVALSPSSLDNLVSTCSLQWFLGREVKAAAPATAAQGFGNVVHVLADEVASGRTPADLDVLMARLDSVWDALAFDAPWKSAQEKQNARVALERFLSWHVMDRGGRTPAASEHGFDVTLEAGAYEVRIRGSMDRVETDEHGRAYVVDFKTGKSAPTKDEVAQHPQLAVYQLAVREGALDEVLDGRRPEPGGAELVQLRQAAPQKEGGDALPKVQAQEPLAGEWVGELLANAAGRVLDERFTPTTGQHCTNCSFRASCSAQPEGRQVVD